MLKWTASRALLDVRCLAAGSSGGNGSTEEGGSSASEPGALAAAEAELARLRTQLRDAGA